MTTFNHPRRTFGLLIACTLFALGMFFPIAAEATGGGTKPAMITGASQVDPATGAFNGRGTLVIDGHVQQITWVSVVTAVTPGLDGTLTLNSSHHITSAQGSSIDFTTVDLVTAEPTNVAGQYTFWSHLSIATGQGRITSGFLEVEGWVDLVHGQVVLHASHGNVFVQP